MMLLKARSSIAVLSIDPLPSQRGVAEERGCRRGARPGILAYGRVVGVDTGPIRPCKFVSTGPPGILR